jgi:hypothetical protein
MWKAIPEWLKEAYEVVWEDSTWKGKLSMFVGIVTGIVVGTMFVHHELAKRGCSIAYHWYNYLEFGMMGIAFLLVGLVGVGLLFRMLLQAPAYMEERRKTADKRREEKRQLKEWRTQRKAEKGYRFIDPEAFEPVIFWAVVILGIVVLVVSTCIALGYMWWSIFC